MKLPPIQKRRGMSVLEVTLALALLGVGVAMAAQVFAICARQRLAGEQVLVAQWEADNVLEHLAGLRYQEVTADSVKTIQPSPQLIAALPEAKLHITVTSSASDDSTDTAPPNKRIHVEVSWPGEDESPHSVGLTGWKFPTTTTSTLTPDAGVPAPNAENLPPEVTP